MGATFIFAEKIEKNCPKIDFFSLGRGMGGKIWKNVRKSFFSKVLKLSHQCHGFLRDILFNSVDKSQGIWWIAHYWEKISNSKMFPNRFPQVLESPLWRLRLFSDSPRFQLHDDIFSEKFDDTFICRFLQHVSIAAC